MYRFYKSTDLKNIKPINSDYRFIKDPYDLYDKLSLIWCKDTCAPRMQDKWSIENKTVGQCSITSFLTQDIFGGDVYGIKLNDGNYHCYNVVDGLIFDLTSEQFGNEKLNYNNNELQQRDKHFAKKEKYERYLYLKKELLNRNS